MSSTVFQLFGEPVSWAELLGFVSGLASAGLAVGQRVWTFAVVLRGSHERRMAEAVRAIDALLRRGWSFAEPWCDRGQMPTSRSTSPAARSTSSATSAAGWRQLPST